MLTLTDTQVLSSLMSITALVLFGIIFYRRYAHSYPGKSNDDKTSNSSSLYRTKYRRLDFLRNRAQRMGLGLSLSLLIALIAMSWTTYELSKMDDRPTFIEVDDLEIIPRTIQEPPKQIQPPPRQVIEEVPEEEIIEEQPDLLDTEIDSDDFIDEAPFVEAPAADPAPAPMLPLPEEPKDDIVEIFDFVQQMPLFGDCGDKACSDRELIRFLAKHVKYPSLALENGIQGKVFAEFVVNADGAIRDINILRGIGGGCDREVVRVLNKMNERIYWQPGKQNGKSVSVRYRLPVTFEPLK